MLKLGIIGFVQNTRTTERHVEKSMDPLEILVTSLHPTILGLMSAPVMAAIMPTMPLTLSLTVSRGSGGSDRPFRPLPFMHQIPLPMDLRGSNSSLCSWFSQAYHGDVADQVCHDGLAPSGLVRPEAAAAVGLFEGADQLQPHPTNRLRELVQDLTKSSWGSNKPRFRIFALRKRKRCAIREEASVPGGELAQAWA